MLMTRRQGALPSAEKNIYFIQLVGYWVLKALEYVILCNTMYAEKLTEISTWEGERHRSEAASASRPEPWCEFKHGRNWPDWNAKKTKPNNDFQFSDLPMEGSDRREERRSGSRRQDTSPCLVYNLSYFLEDLTITFCLVAFKQMEKTAMMLKISLH